MTECYFINELSKLFLKLDDDWDWGDELDREVVDIINLCKQFLEEKGYYESTGKSE